MESIIPRTIWSIFNHCWGKVRTKFRDMVQCFYRSIDNQLLVILPPSCNNFLIKLGLNLIFKIPFHTKRLAIKSTNFTSTTPFWMKFWKKSLKQQQCRNSFQAKNPRDMKIYLIAKLDFIKFRKNSNFKFKNHLQQLWACKGRIIITMII